MRVSSGHSVFQGAAIRTHGIPALPSPAPLPPQRWAVTTNYVLNRHSNRPGRLKTLIACKSQEMGNREGWRWGKKNQERVILLSNVWAGWVASDELPLADAADAGPWGMNALLKALTFTSDMQICRTYGLYFKFPWERVKSSGGKNFIPGLQPTLYWNFMDKVLFYCLILRITFREKI